MLFTNSKLGFNIKVSNLEKQENCQVTINNDQLIINNYHMKNLLMI
jgi:hypothetical protein